MRKGARQEWRTLETEAPGAAYGRLLKARLEMVDMAETYKGDAYCVKCKEKREFEGTVKVSDSGRRMAQGICSVCGTKLNRILGKAQ